MAPANPPWSRTTFSVVVFFLGAGSGRMPHHVDSTSPRDTRTSRKSEMVDRMKSMSSSLARGREVACGEQVYVDARARACG